MVLTKKGKSTLLGIVAYGAIAVCAILICVKSINANAAGGGQGFTDQSTITNNSGCYTKSSKTSSTWTDECYGAGWKLYSVDDAAEFSVDQSTVRDWQKVCKDFGGQYYRLGLANFYTNGSKKIANFTPTGKLKYFYQVKKITYGGGGIPYVTGNGLLPWDEVKADFDAAQRYAREHPDSWIGNLANQKWEDTSGFCWDESWRNDSGFVSNSTLSVSAGSDFSGITKTSPDDGSVIHEIDTFDDKITVTFWHNLKYKTNLEDLAANAEVEQAWTNWYVWGDDDASIRTTQSTFRTDARYNAASEALAQRTVEITVPRGTEKTVCDYISYDPKTHEFSEEEFWGRFYYRITNSFGSGGSRACVKVTNSSNKNVGSFWSKSFVEVPAQNDVPGYKVDENTVTPNGTASIKLSTDMDYINVIFWHKLYYSEDLYIGVSPYIFDDVTTEYFVSRTNYNPGAVKDRTTFHTNGTGANSGSEVSRTGDGQTGYRIDLPNPGDRVKVCEVIHYEPSTVVMKSVRHNSSHGTKIDDDHPFDHNHYYKFSSSGRGESSACVEVVRAKEPDLPGPFSGNSASSTSTYMYTGETTDIGWDTNAKGVAERRVAEYRAIEFLWHAAVPYSLDTVSGTVVSPGSTQQSVYPNRKNIDPCAWYNNKSRQEQCAIAKDETITDQQLIVDTQNTTYSSDGILYPYKKSLNIAVPDEVGYKLCNSFGYKWEYWYSISYDGVDNWKHETAQDYWNVFNASCRSIAKKPSMAIWNGSIFTTGEVDTSISQRFSNNTYQRFLLFNVASNNAGARLIYGSWDEYIGAIGGSVNGFATGTTYSRGNPDSSPYSESLTISNASDIGNSQIPVNSASYVRLRNYLESRATRTNDISALGVVSGNTINVNGTHIISTSGDLTINRNIVVPGGPYSDIYSIPQAIIFANGNVNISPDVTRIDAWIISTGTINTCNAFVTRSTGTTASAGSTHGVYTTNTACDKQLTFNGPVMANELKLNRTGGSDPSVPGNYFSVSNSQRYTPAEVFNLRADTYLWAYAQAGRYGSSYTEAYTRELPPRY